jgi:spore coat protein U-like protein
MAWLKQESSWNKLPNKTAPPHGTYLAADNFAHFHAWEKGMESLLNAKLYSAIALIGAATATAAPVQTTFQVTSSVSAVCTVTAAGMDFGAYQGKQHDQTSSITVTCNKGTSYQIGLDNGVHYSAPYRRLKHRTTDNYLIYELYRDAVRTARWGNDDASRVHMTSDGEAQHINVYGRVPAGQTGPIGSYSNTTTVTVNF